MGLLLLPRALPTAWLYSRYPVCQRRIAVGNVHPFAHVRSFSPDTLQIMGVALDCSAALRPTGRMKVARQL